MKLNIFGLILTFSFCLIQSAETQGMILDSLKSLRGMPKAFESALGIRIKYDEYAPETVLVSYDLKTGKVDGDKLISLIYERITPQYKNKARFFCHYKGGDQVPFHCNRSGEVFSPAFYEHDLHDIKYIQVYFNE